MSTQPGHPIPYCFRLVQESMTLNHLERCNARRRALSLRHMSFLYSHRVDMFCCRGQSVKYRPSWISVWIVVFSSDKYSGTHILVAYSAVRDNELEWIALPNFLLKMKSDWWSSFVDLVVYQNNNENIKNVWLFWRYTQFYRCHIHILDRQVYVSVNARRVRAWVRTRVRTTSKEQKHGHVLYTML